MNSYEEPSWSIEASVEDVAKWMRLSLSKGLYEGTRLLSEEVINEMLSPQELTNRIQRFPLGAGSGNFWARGMDWALTDYRGRRIAMHGGGFRSLVALMPEENLGVAFLTNHTRGSGRLRAAIPLWIFDAYLGGPKRDWSTEYLAMADAERASRQQLDDELAAQRQQGTQPSLSIERYEGTYSHPVFGEVNVTRKDHNLVLHWRSGATIDVKHWHYDVFYTTRSDGSVLDFVVFTLDPLRHVQELRITGVLPPIYNPEQRHTEFPTVFKRLSNDPGYYWRRD